MPDLLDDASDLEEYHRIAALHRVVNRSESVNNSGLCYDCGEPIDARRLKVLPTAKRCVECL